MVQPVVSNQIFSSTILVDQGFMSRCLLSQPISTIGQRGYRDLSVTDTGAYKRFFGTIMDILEYPLPLCQGKANELEPRTLTLAPEAKATWVGYHDQVEELMAEGQPLSTVRGFAAKAPEHAARLAGVMTLLEDLEASVIPNHLVEAGISLAQYYVKEALRLYHTREDDPDLILAENCLDWIRGRGGTVALPDLYQRGPSGVRSKAKALDVMRILEGHGYAMLVEGGMEVEGIFRREVWRVRS